MPESKIVRVGYGFVTNTPHRKSIEKAINKWGAKGYKLVSRQEDKPGCFTMAFTAFLARGVTELTFIKDD